MKRFQQKLCLAHIALHREKAGEEDGDLGVAIKVTGGVKLQDLGALVGDEHTLQLLDHLYDGEGNLHTDNVEGLALSVKHEDVACVLRAGPTQQKFKDAVVDNIRLTPKLSRVVEVTARLKVHPSETQTGWLGVMMGSDAIVTLEGGKTSVGAADEQTPLPLPDQGKSGNGRTAAAH